MAASTILLCRVGLSLLVVSSHAQAQTAEGPYGGTAATIPGIIEAEEFDYGGEGVGYSDTTTDNIQQDFRLNEAVDVRASDGGGYGIGHTAAGEYLRYTVDVTEDVDAFDFNFVVSSDQDGGSFRIVSGGTDCDDYTTDLSGTVTVSDTGGWQQYADLAVSWKGDGGLEAGPAYLWLCVLTAHFNIDSFTMTTPLGSPYGGAPATVPGLIEAEEFDYGGEGVGYSDSTTANIQQDYRLDEAVDINALDGGGYNVGYITVGEYLRYTVDVTEDVDVFYFSYVVSADQDTGSFRIVSGGTGCDDYTTDLSGTVTVPNTGGWSNYEYLTGSGEGDGGLEAGSAYIWLCALTETFNIDSFTATPGLVSPTPTPPSRPYGGVAATVPGLIEAEEFDYGGEGVGYSDSTPNNIQGAFRPDEAVDIHALEVGYNIGYITVGEYLRYTVDVTEDVYEFDFNFVVSADQDTGSFRIVSGGTGCDDYTTDLSGTVTVSDTGGWQEYEDLAVSGEGDGGLEAGSAYIWLCALTETFNIDSFTMDIASSDAYSGTPTTIPGLIEAEEFDNGGQGVAYYDTTRGNRGGAFRTDERVDVGSTDDGYYIGWMVTDEFLHYTVHVWTDVDALDFIFLVAGPKKNAGSFRVVTGGTGCADYTTDLSGLVSVPSNGWSNYGDVSIYGAGTGGLSAGTSVIRLCVVGGRFTIDSFSVTEHI